MARPNVVVILVDDMGYGDFGFINGGLTQTPHLDALAAEGTVLTQHYSASPVCAPARAGLLTGRYPLRTGAIDTLEALGLDRLALRETTLAEHFASAGYATGLVGKWHNGAADKRYHPLNRGFKEFVGFRGGWSDYYDYWLDWNGTFRPSDGTYLTDVFTEAAVDFIQRHKREPFFLFLAYNAPHFPMQAPPEDVAPFAETGKFTRAVSTLYGMIKRMDAGVGQVLTALQKAGVYDNTLVLFTSDNGPQFGGKGEDCTTRYNCNFAGAKCLVYEGGIRVPAIVHWPDGFERLETFDRMVHFTDWFPTLLAACKLVPEGGLPLDGVNVLPALQGMPQETPEVRCWQWNRYVPCPASNAAIRSGDWKLVRPALGETFRVAPEHGQLDRAIKRDPRVFTKLTHFTPPDFSGLTPPKPQLFNLAEDPYERHNLAEAKPDLFHRLNVELETWFEEVEAERRSITE